MIVAVALWSSQGLSATLQHLPPAAHLLAAGGLIVGLVLWIAGHRILRIVFAALGGLSGAGAGFFLLPTVAAETIAGYPSPHVGLAAGGLIGLVLGILLFRFAVAILLAGGLGIAASLLAAAAVQFQPIADTEAMRRGYEDLTAPLAPTPPPFDDDPYLYPPESEPPPAPSLAPAPPPELDEQGEPPHEPDRLRQALDSMKPVAERIRIFLQARAEEFADAWSGLTSRQQGIVISATLAGLISGFLLGLLFPTRSSAAATAMAGAAVWLPCLAWLWRTMEAPGADRLLALSPGAWLAIWAGAAVIGFVIQSAGSIRWRRRKS
jgi:hypothetical protein